VDEPRRKTRKYHGPKGAKQAPIEEPAQMTLPGILDDES